MQYNIVVLYARRLVDSKLCFDQKDRHFHAVLMVCCTAAILLSCLRSRRARVLRVTCFVVMTTTTPLTSLLHCVTSATRCSDLKNWKRRISSSSRLSHSEHFRKSMKHLSAMDNNISDVELQCILIQRRCRAVGLYSPCLSM